MENKDRKIRVRRLINNTLSETIVPVKAIGKLLFFDYNKNKFGYIVNIHCLLEQTIEKIHVSENGLAAQRRLHDGEIVTFVVNRGNRGFYATDVDSFTKITLETVSEFLPFISVHEIEKIIYNTVKHEYDKIGLSYQLLIGNVLIANKSDSAWSLLVKLKNRELIQKYIDSQIAILPDDEKINYLKVAYHETLLEHILLTWEATENDTVLSLIELINSSRAKIDYDIESFINHIKNISWNFDEIWIIYQSLKSLAFAKLALDNFSFSTPTCIYRLRSLLSESEIDDIQRQKLLGGLFFERERIETDILTEIFETLSTFFAIETLQLLNLLNGRSLKQKQLANLLSKLTGTYNISDLKGIISKSVSNLYSWQIVDLIELCNGKNEISKVLINEYIATNIAKIDFEFQSLINALKTKNETFLIKYSLNKFYKQLEFKDPFFILELAVSVGNIDAQKLSYQNIKFNSENELLNVINKISQIILNDEVISCNKPLRSFLSLLKSDSIDILSDDLKSFLSIHKGIVQCFCVKFLIFKFHRKVINKSKLLDLLNSYRWTEISALLVKAFIEESNFTEKILLDKLNLIFKKHFEILNDQHFEPKSFKDNFTIYNILNKCNGRKYYAGNVWQGKGISRWYVKNGVSTFINETMDCYCEGRPWKKETFWDSVTNKPLPNQYEKYWCRTSYCAERNDNANLESSFQDWTFSEIASVTGIIIEKNVLAILSGWANKMNQIVDHLICRECGEVLRPLPFNPKILGYNSVPVFQCINSKCSKYEMPIRFTHCLNGKCESHKESKPLDSRDCKSCKPNDPKHIGMQCNYYGSSCPSCSGYSNRIIAQDNW